VRISRRLTIEPQQPAVGRRIKVFQLEVLLLPEESSYRCRMRVACPGCAIVYEPPDHLLTPGRRLRCARCGETWAIEGLPEAATPPSEPAAAEPDPEEPEAEPEASADEVQHSPAAIAARRIGVSHATVPAVVDRLRSSYDPPESRSSVAGVVAGWCATAAVLAGLAWGAYTYRGEVMAAWPPSTRVYAGLGLMK